MLLLQARSVEWAATIQMLNRRTVAVNAFHVLFDKRDRNVCQLARKKRSFMTN